MRFPRLFLTLIVGCLPFLFASSGYQVAGAQDAPMRVAQIPFFDKKPIDVPDEPGSVFRECDHCPQMVVIPPGRFTMGSPEDEEGRFKFECTEHVVSFEEPFAIGVHEVTFDQWGACVDRGGCEYEPNDEEWGSGDRPVINVSWLGAMAYASWLSRETGADYRIPSEQEWEYAARAGTTASRFWGNEAYDACSFASVFDRTTKESIRMPYDHHDCDDGFAHTAPVGSFRPNGFGVHDILGNVWEWVDGCWHDTCSGMISDTGDCYYRAMRGGAWNSEPNHVRAALRIRDDQDMRDKVSGFRVARTLSP